MKKAHRVIKFNQNTLLKSYIDMKTKLRHKAKNNFAKDFFKLMNNAVFGKTMKDVMKHRNIELVAIVRRRKYLIWEPNYHTTKSFTEITLLHCSCKNRRYLQRYSQRCWNKIWDFKLSIRETIAKRKKFKSNRINER